MIKKLVSFIGVVFSLAFFTGCDVSSMSNLSEISRPYTGEYKCEKLLLGGKDMIDRFDYLKLDLAYDGDFEFRYRGADGNEGEYIGEYSVSPSGEQITFTAKNGLRSVSQNFPIKDGTILVDWTLGTKLLHAEFCLP